MADLLAPVGAVVMRNDGTLLGVVERATASSAWIDGKRHVAGPRNQGPGVLVEHGAMFAWPRYVVGSPAHAWLMSDLEGRRAAREAVEAVSAARKRVATAMQEAIDRGPKALPVEYGARAVRLADAVEALLREAP